MGQLKYETGMKVAAAKGAVYGINWSPSSVKNFKLIPEGTVGVIIAVDIKDRDLPYLVQFDDFEEWMFESEIIPLDEVDQ